MRLNFRKLRFTNSAGLRVIIDFLKAANQARKLDIQLIGSKVVALGGKDPDQPCRPWANGSASRFSTALYESQGIIEDAQFIPLLRNQTRLLWPWNGRCWCSTAARRPEGGRHLLRAAGT
jgi:hypothetical protein